MYTDDISLALSNQEHPPKPNLYIGNGSTALSLTFTVNADEGVVLTPDGAIQIFMPRQVFAEEEVKRMSVSAPGWSYTGVDGARGRYFLMKPVTGQTLARGTSFAFTLSNVACAKPKQVAGNVTAKFVGIDVFPSDSNAPLSLCAVPQGNPRDLMEAIAFTLSGIEESSSSVYRSDELSSPVKNTLVLNIKNKRADRAVIDNVTAWNKDEVPTLSIFFVYGDSPGALTQGWVDSIDSAGKIKANLHELYANKWHPTWPGQGGELSWQLTPLKDSNHEALGFGPDANVDIEFTDIVTTAPIGHTQMYIHYHSFPGYLDGIATLDIHKKQPKRGVLGFKASPSLVYVGDSVNLIWSTCDIAKVILSYEDENKVEQRFSSQPNDPAATLTPLIPLNGQGDINPFPVKPKQSVHYKLFAYASDGTLIRTADERESEEIEVAAIPDITIRYLRQIPILTQPSDFPVQTKYKWQVINGNGVDISIGLDPDVHNAGSDAPLESRTITVAKPQGVQAILKWGGWTLATRTLFTGSFSIQHSGNLGFTSAPNGIVWSDHRLFVTDGDNIAVFQEPGLTRIKTIALPPGSGASKMALMPGGRKLYVTNNNDTICVIDTKAMTFLSAVAVPDKLSDAYRPAMSPRGDRVYFPCAWGDQDSHSGLFSMDTVNDSIATVFDYQDVTDVYYSVAVAPDGKTIYSTGTYGKTLTILDATVPNKKIIATLPLPDHVADTGGGQIVISPNGNKLWVAAVADHLYVGNPLTKDPFVDVAAIPGRMINFKGWAGAAAISLIADVIYLATDSMIYVVSIHEDNEILAAIPAGGMDMTIAPADMGETLYLTGGSGLTSVQIRWQS